MKRELPKCLRVMADYGSSGIWVVEAYGPFRHGMVEHHALGIPDDLAREFRTWIEEYWKVLDDRESWDATDFNTKGRRLAVFLKEFVGPHTRVLFAPERTDGGLGDEEEVQAGSA